MLLLCYDEGVGIIACLAFREVQRILMELLNQMDGFDQTVNVKVIMATNRADTLDPALLRPGRLDRKIEFPLPDRRQKRLVFQVSSALAAYCLPIPPCISSRKAVKTWTAEGPRCCNYWK